MKLAVFIRKAFSHPEKIVLNLGRRGLLNWMPDETYLGLVCRLVFHKKLDLSKPETFNEKLQWLKIHDRKPEYPQMADKYEAKQYISSAIGEEYIIENYGVWDSFDAVDLDSLPDQFVLKCTHDSGGVVICKDRSSFDLDAARKKIETSLKRNFYYFGRDWPYKDIRPRILAEKYLKEKDGKEIADYKVHCFEGEPKVILVCKDIYQSSGMTEDFYDVQWNHLDVCRPGISHSAETIEKPVHLEKMLEISKRLSSSMHFLRIDFYEYDEKLYFGEMTFYPSSGFTPFVPEEADLTFGKWIDCP